MMHQELESNDASNSIALNEVPSIALNEGMRSIAIAFSVSTL